MPAERFEGTGFFRVAQDCERWTLVTPDGARFFSAGVNSVTFLGDFEPSSGTRPYHQTVEAKYADAEAWGEQTAARLQAWGWNTAGSWSQHEVLGAHMPFTVNLSLAGANWQTGEFPDYFTDAWAEAVRARAEAAMPALADAPNLIGYFIDNELRWGPDWRSHRTLLDEYLLLDPDAPGREALHALLVSRHESIERFNEVWDTSFTSFDALAVAHELPSTRRSSKARADVSAFAGAVAHRFFSVTVGAIRAHDPHRLILGVRFVSPLTPRAVVQAAGEYVDVVSVNAYEYELDPAQVWNPKALDLVPLDLPLWLEGFHLESGKPVLVSEFGFRAADSGLPNSHPPTYPVLQTQQERADRFEAYARRCFEAPFIVGYHWFKHSDQPAGGRFDGENNNFGLVDRYDAPYVPLTERSARINAEAALLR